VFDTIKSLWRPDQKQVEQSIQTPQQLEAFLLSVVSNSSSGIRVTPETAMQCSAVAASVRLIYNGVSQVPANIYRKLDNGGKELAKDHRNYKLLAYRANNYQTSRQFRQTMQMHFCLYGNAYARPIRVRNRILELHPVHPNAVTPKQRSEDLAVEYKIRLANGSTETTTDLFHLKDGAIDSIQGQSRVVLGKQSIGLAIAAEKFGALFFKNGAKSSGAWKTPGKLDEEPFERLKSQLNDAYSGDSAHTTPILEDGLDWIKTGFNAKESQLTELREHQVVEIARIFGVPPHMIQHLMQATFSNIEHQGREFLQTGLRPWTDSWEDQLQAFLLDDDERDSYLVEFDVDSFSRGDLEARTAFYNSGIQWGYISPNEARRSEGLPDREGGDEYLRPVNMVAADENDLDED